MKFTRLVSAAGAGAGTVILAVAGSQAAQAAQTSPASAAHPASAVRPAGIRPPPTTDYPILWGLTDGTLAVQSVPAVNNVIYTLTPDINTVSVICQTVNGGTDPYDGLASTTWDEIWLDNRVGYVYDTFIGTPPQGSDGYSQGPDAPPICPGG